MSNQKNTSDHREINRNLDLYHIQEDSSGMVFWHNNGWIIFNELKNFIRRKLKKYDYLEVSTPIITNRLLWEQTGHWSNYSHNIFDFKSDEYDFCIKPMNCPGHIQIFKQSIKSYKDLPMRISEFGICHRKEPSGALHGLMRLKSFTQDDAHIFCTNEQVINEIDLCIKITLEIYKIFGFENITVTLSTRPKNSIGNIDIWNRAEKDLISALKNNKIKFKYKYGEGAFYGPKIEFIFLDCLNRYWQCGTIQLDFYLPKLLNVSYVNSNNIKSTPIIIHRAILGSIERFIGIITEEFSGIYPTWLAPIQVVVLNVGLGHSQYAIDIRKKLYELDIRAVTDLKNETINSKIRKYSIKKIPYILVCGEKEINTKTIMVRSYHKKSVKIFSICVSKFIDQIKQEISSNSLYKIGE